VWGRFCKKNLLSKQENFNLTPELPSTSSINLPSSLTNLRYLISQSVWASPKFSLEKWTSRKPLFQRSKIFKKMSRSCLTQIARENKNLPEMLLHMLKKWRKSYMKRLLQTHRSGHPCIQNQCIQPSWIRIFLSRIPLRKLLQSYNRV